MWTSEVLKMDIFRLVQCFILYSMLGWLVESIYMSICNHKITNRGFSLTPFCPIYGFGAILGYYILVPLSQNVIALYLCGAIIATIFEFFVGVLMQRVLGEVWWDYTDKPFNYKGLICLESTLAWGVYAVVIVDFLHVFTLRLVDRIPYEIGTFVCVFVLIIYAFDFLYHFFEALGVSVKDFRKYTTNCRERIYERYQDFRTKW